MNSPISTNRSTVTNRSPLDSARGKSEQVSDSKKTEALPSGQEKATPAQTKSSVGFFTRIFNSIKNAFNSLIGKSPAKSEAPAPNINMINKSAPSDLLEKKIGVFGDLGFLVKDTGGQEHFVSHEDVARLKSNPSETLSFKMTAGTKQKLFDVAESVGSHAGTSSRESISSNEPTYFPPPLSKPEEPGLERPSLSRESTIGRESNIGRESTIRDSVGGRESLSDSKTAIKEESLSSSIGEEYSQGKTTEDKISGENPLNNRSSVSGRISTSSRESESLSPQRRNSLDRFKPAGGNILARPNRVPIKSSATFTALK